MKRPLFSCVIPVKGPRPYFDEALRSLLSQGMGDDLEIIVQDADVRSGGVGELNHEIHERHEKREDLGDSAGGSFDLNHGIRRTHGNEEPLHLLYLGRQHPLKGLEYLEEAVKELVVSRQSLVVSEKDLTKSKRETRNTKPETRNIELKIVSNAFGEELEKVWAWCDVLVLPTLSENFGLVVAEALERGKRVITTDGAPA